MTKYSAADADKWADKFDAILDAITKQATNDMLNSIDISVGIARGGSRVRGTIPRDLGALAGSLQSTLYGGTPISSVGEDSYELVVGRMHAGDKALFTWGGSAAPYARAVHYGVGSLQGTFWRDIAAAGWGGYVEGATRKAKAIIR